MSQGSVEKKHKKLVKLIRKVAKDVFYELMNEHLDDYEHKRKPAEEVSDYES
ncbi:hypothetical protein KEJ15_01155 [Candidatus Bathyarchaeota archaeon]|nr:hypothetical protein [Candidatus Bathyarchaeota archaeon]